MTKQFIFSICMMSLILLSIWIALSSGSWIGVWVGLELSTLSFVGYLSSGGGASYESGVKYFLVQSSASFLFLYASFFSQSSAMFVIMMILTLFLKLGSAPFHLWVPMVASGITWEGNIIFLTLQKIIPLWGLCLLYNGTFSYLYGAVSVMSCLLGGLGGWNELSLRKLLSFSSINHSGWMVACGMMSGWVWYTYWVFYSILSSGLMLILSGLSLDHINDLSMKASWLPRLMLCIVLLSLAGVPPLTGFMLKLVVLEASLNYSLQPLVYLLLTLSIVLMSFYLRLTLNSLSQTGLSGMEGGKKIMIFMTLLSSLGGVVFLGEVWSSLQMFMLL